MNIAHIFLTKLLKKTPHFHSNFSTSPTQFLPTISTCISILQSCAHHNNLTKGKQTHCYMLTNGFLSLPAITSLINFYSKCNQPHHARTIFDSTSDRNLFTWNSIIAGFIHNHLPNDALHFFYKMRYWDNIIPDKFTFPCVIKACYDIAQVGKIHGELFKLGLDNDVYIATSLINVYLKYHYMVEARKVFEELPELNRDVVLWNAMVTGFSQIGSFKEALEVFGKMVEQGMSLSKFTVTGVLSVFAMVGDVKNGRVIHGLVFKNGFNSDVVVSNSLIDMYGKCKCVGEAVEIFEEMVERDIFSWNSVISVHEQSADYSGTLRFFYRMQEARVQPDIVTVTSVLQACSHLAVLMRGKELHGYMIVGGLKDDELQNIYADNAVMDMYAKCGSLEEAQLLFDKMRRKDRASWNILILGYGMHGYSDEALCMFSRMLEANIKPDEVTFVSVLTACSHAGLVDQGCEILGQMESDHGVVPVAEHYACVVDMLGRAGKLEEAYQLVLTLPIQPNPVVWGAFLAGCHLHGKTALAEIAAKQLFEVDPKHTGGHVLISNIFGSIGRYENVSDTRHTMKIQNVRKNPGCSWIELKTGVHVFVTRDNTHPDSDQIYLELGALAGHLCEYGYVPD